MPIPESPPTSDNLELLASFLSSLALFLALFVLCSHGYNLDVYLRRSGIYDYQRLARGDVSVPQASALDNTDGPFNNLKLQNPAYIVPGLHKKSPLLIVKLLNRERANRDDIVFQQNDHYLFFA